MKKISALIITTLFLTTVFAQELNFSGTVGTIWGITAPGTDKAGSFSAGQIDFTPSIEAYLGNGSAKVEGTVGYNGINNSLILDLNEAYIDYSSSFWGFRLGFQKNAWGKADGINITNSVFPEDSSTLFSDDSSLATVCAKISFSGNFFNIDALWIPFFRGSTLPLEEGNPLKSIIIPSSVTLTGLGTIPVTVGNISQPEMAIKNSEFGIKMSGYFSFCDISLYGYYGWEKTPLISYVPVINQKFIPTEILINGEYSRITMFGIDSAIPIGPVVLRLEGAFFPERRLQSSSMYIISGGTNGVSQNQLMALAGIDWMPSGWTITAQYYCDALLNKSELLQREETYKHGATLSVSKTFIQDTLEISLSGLLGLNYFDSAMTFETKYSLTDQIKISGGTYIFLPGPLKNGTYGELKNLSSIFIKGQFCF